MDLFGESWRALRQAVTELRGGQWVAQSGCTGWLVQDLVFHLIIDAQDVLITLASPTEAAATRDSVTYWEPEEVPTGTDPVSAFTRRSSAAYESAEGLHGLRDHLFDLADAGARAAAAADPVGRVETRGEVMTVADYLGVYVVEWTLHHLDLIAYLPEVSGPPAETVAETKRVVEAVVGASLPLPDRDAVLVATGRRAPTEVEARALGDLGQRLPVVLG
jgi:hypothetical protein